MTFRSEEQRNSRIRLPSFPMQSKLERPQSHMIM